MATEANAHCGVVACVTEEFGYLRGVVWQTDVVSEAARGGRPETCLECGTGWTTDWLACHCLGDMRALARHAIEVRRQVHWIAVQ